MIFTESGTQHLLSAEYALSSGEPWLSLLSIAFREWQKPTPKQITKYPKNPARKKSRPERGWSARKGGVVVQWALEPKRDVLPTALQDPHPAPSFCPLHTTSLGTWQPLPGRRQSLGGLPQEMRPHGNPGTPCCLCRPPRLSFSATENTL